MKIFYSWQSWTRSNTNWTLIQNAIEIAIKKIISDETLEVEPVLDRDTQGKAGSVSIAETIFEKIDECQIFICDVTIVTEDDTNRPIPNPNVLVELGYAAARLGWENIICVVNEAYGKVDTMPFDLRHRRLLTYNLAEEADSKSEERRRLADKLFGAIKVIVEATTHVSTTNPVEKLKQIIHDPAKQIDVEELLGDSVEETYSKFTSEEFYKERYALINQPDTNEEQRWVDCFQLYFTKCESALNIFSTLSWHGNEAQAQHLEDGIERWMTMPQGDEKHRIWCYIPVLLLVYTCGIEAIYKRNWRYILAVLLNPTTQHPDLYNNPKVPMLRVLAEKPINEFYKSTFEMRRKQWMTHGQYIRPLIRPIFSDAIRTDDHYNIAFDLFEMMLGFGYISIQNVEKESGWIPPHDAMMKKTSRSDMIEFWKERGRENNSWMLVGTRYLPNLDRIEKHLETYDAINAKSGTRFPEDLPHYLSAYRDGLKESAS